jgi:ribosomal protein S12 methylthiotransferase accessory factor
MTEPSTLELLARCADALEGAAIAALDADVRGVLVDLEYLPPSDVAPTPGEAANGARLLRAAGRFRRIFELGAPDAPGLTFFGAEADPSSVGASNTDYAIAGVSGVGLSRRRAFESCVGEGVEYLSQFESDEDEIVDGGGERQEQSATLRRYIEALLLHRVEPIRDMGWVAAKRLADGERCFLPADICLRRRHDRRAIAPPFMLGTGCAAGPSFEAAALHGLLELIERDAASLWWRGGRRGHAVAPESEAGEHAAELLAQIRQGMQNRASWLLDITTDVGVPCVAAVSATVDGFGFSCGVAARPTMSMAAQSAIFEMCQSELAHAVVEAKRQERGDAALNARDLAHLQRKTGLDTRACALLHPLPPRGHTLEHDDKDTARTLRVVVDRLAGMGLETFAVDLTRRTFALPVVRIVAPGLQLEPSEIVGERLAATRVETGGGEAHTCRVALF